MKIDYSNLCHNLHSLHILMSEADLKALEEVLLSVDPLSVDPREFTDAKRAHKVINAILDKLPE